MLTANDYKKAFDAVGADAEHEQHDIFERCGSIATLTVTASDCLKAGIAAAEYLGKNADVAATLKQKIADIKAAEQRISNYDAAIKKSKDLKQENSKLTEKNCDMKKRIDELESKRDAIELDIDTVVPALVRYSQAGTATRLRKFELNDKQILALKKLDVLR